jgi:hypothetical protein
MRARCGDHQHFTLCSLLASIKQDFVSGISIFLAFSKSENIFNLLHHSLIYLELQSSPFLCCDLPSLDASFDSTKDLPNRNIV